MSETHNDTKNLMSIVGPWRATLFSGLLIAASHPPFDYGPLILIAFIPWLLALEHFKTTRGAICAGWCAGFLVHLLGIFYLSQMPSMTGNQAFMYFMWVFVSAIMAMYYGIFSGVARWAMCRLSRTSWLLIIPVLWVGFEFCRYYFPAPAPLLLTGYALHHFPVLIQIADLGSVHLVALLIMLVNASFVVWLDARRHGVIRSKRLAVTVLVLAFAAAICYGSFRLMNIHGQLRDNGPLIVVVQPNIQQDFKETDTQGAREQRFQEHVALSKESLCWHPDLIIWSETALPLPAVRPGMPYGYFAQLQNFTRSINTPVIAGTITLPTDDDARHYSYLTKEELACSRFNTAWYLDSMGNVAGRHDKKHLVPGGEYIPFRETPLGSLAANYAIELMGAIPELLPGWRHERFELVDKSGRHWSFSMNICYEFLFPQFVNELHGEENVHFSINLSNEAWYKGLAELDQALIATQFRAIESRTSFVRATNTGISAIIDPTGEIRGMLTVDGKDRDVRGVLAQPIPYLENPTPTIATNMGLWLATITIPGALGLMFWSWMAWCAVRLKRVRTKA